MIINYFGTIVIVLFLLSGCSTLFGPSHQQRQAYIDSHPYTEAIYQQAILKGEIMIGMNKEQVLASWGPPRDINRTVTAYGTIEHWTYGLLDPPSHYLYFEGDTLTSFQN